MLRPSAKFMTQWFISCSEEFQLMQSLSVPLIMNLILMQQQLNTFSIAPSSILRCIDLKLEAIDLAGSICHLLTDRNTIQRRVLLFKVNLPWSPKESDKYLNRSENERSRLHRENRERKKKCAKSLSNASCFVTPDSFTCISEVFLADASHVLSDLAEDDSHWTQLLWYFKEVRL